VLLAVDQRPAMQFGSQHCFKAVLAAELAALLAWSALGSNERVGALLLRAQDHWEMRPRNSRRTVLALLSALAEAPAQADKLATPGRFTDLLRSARRVARPARACFSSATSMGCRKRRPSKSSSSWRGTRRSPPSTSRIRSKPRCRPRASTA
jgi:uncharacterized protein (DUF58 family)